MISATEEMGVITVYVGDPKHQLQDVSRLLDRANQALQTLERYKARLDDAIANLTSASRSRTSVTCATSSPSCSAGEMVHRIAEEIETMIVELGVDARLLRLQLDELLRRHRRRARPRRRRLPAARPHGRRHPGRDVAAQPTTRCSTCASRPATLAPRRRQPRPRPGGRAQGAAPAPPRAPPARRCRPPTIADHFGGLAKLQRATVADLMEVDDVDDALAMSIKDTLERVTESTILDQYS